MEGTMNITSTLQRMGPESLIAAEKEIERKEERDRQIFLKGLTGSVRSFLDEKKRSKVKQSAKHESTSNRTWR
jgi:hypothetical protein